MAERQVEDESDGPERDHEREAAAYQADPGEHGGEQRQVHRHRQVLHDEDAEDDGGFAVAELARGRS